MHPNEAPNWNHRWAAWAVSELWRHGVRHFFVSPGSRSTPLAWAVASHPEARCHVHFDERGAAFAALGCVRALEVPSALVCTSGSAVANYFPAVVEADASRAPLLLLTADRPPELLDCGANQAIDQYKIFGDYLRWFQQLPSPGPELPDGMLLSCLAQAIRRATGPNAGPVQLNFSFREPLAPTDMPMPPVEPALLRRHSSGKPYTAWHTTPTPLSADGRNRLANTLAQAQRGLLVVGQLRNAKEARACHMLAKVLNWPVFADAAANLYQAGATPQATHYYDALLRNADFARACAPEVVLHLGGALVSKRLGQHLAECDALFLQLNAHPERQDPDHRIAERYEADLPTACAQLCRALQGYKINVSREWTRGWREADAQLDAYLSQQLETTDALSEPAVLRAVSRQGLRDSVLFVGNSMPIRDLDMFGAPPPNNPADNLPLPWTAANRGASGIDGNIATAWGWALGSGRPVTAVLGDLAALHDLNSLAYLRQAETPFTLIVINNDGGGIFSFLPVAKHTTHFERLFGAPHGLDFAAAAQMFGLDYDRPLTLHEFASAYADSQQRAGARLIEVQTNRMENVAWHEELQAGMQRILAEFHFQ